jgi:DNA invertase Pin-like site-specific DNA recombinase
MTRALITALALIALMWSAAVTPAWAQGAGEQQSGGGRPPTELWDEFPLKQPPPGSAKQGGAEQRARGSGSERQGGDGGSSGTLLLLLGLVALAGLGALVPLGIRRRRRRSRIAAGRPPAQALPAAAAKAAAQPAQPVATAVAAQDGNGATRKPAPSRSDLAGQSAVGYASVSAADDLNNAELKVQVRLIQEACRQRGLKLVKVVRDVESHGSSDLKRPGLSYALDRLAAREASCLVVASIERLTRTAANLGALLGWLTECDARLIVIDLDLDTGTEEGRLGARALATVGGIERRKLEERTRKGLETARSMRRSGRPAVSDRPSLKQRIADMRAEGMTLQAIADTLNAEGVPTLRGGAEWRPSSVQAAAGYKRPRRKGVLQAPAPPRDKSA